MNDFRRIGNVALVAIFVLTVYHSVYSKDETGSKAPSFRVDTVQGRVGWYSQLLSDQLGVSTVSDSAERVLAIATDDGEVLPLIEDLRVRAFRKDERLRDMHVALLVRRYKQTPSLQVMKLFEVDVSGKRYEVDYWCDVCAIVMFEYGACACCQDDNRLRKRLLDKSGKPLPEE